MKNKVVLPLIAAILSSLMHANAQTLFHTEIAEHVLYENIKQGPNSVQYYQYKIQNENYFGQEHLTFKVIADEFDSDPDIFISKSKNNLYPNSAWNADWYCERKGSETCIIQKGDFAIGETLYIGITCNRQCSYKLRIWFTPTVDLSTSNRRQIRFDAFSTYIMKYTIPEEVQEDITKSVEIYVQPEHAYSPIDLFLSLDQSFYLIEETPSAHVTSTGKAIKFSENEENWCRNCDIYVILNIYDEDRYYITSLGRVENDELSNDIPQDIFVNQFQQQCYQYFVERTKFETRIEVQGYSGHADAYVSAKTLPSGPDSDTVDLRVAHGPNRAILLSTGARTNFGQVAGTYYVCFYAYTPFSARITVNEAEDGVYTEAKDNQIMSYFTLSNQYFVSRYKNSAFTSDGVVTVWLEGQKLNADQDPPELYYRVCDYTSEKDCNIEEANLGNGYLCKLGEDANCPAATSVQVTKGVGTIATISHSPSQCPDPNSCIYIFGIRNQISDRTISIKVNGKFTNPGDVLLEKQYKNSIAQGQYVPHRINPDVNPKIQPYIRQLKITVNSLVGDADLFVSMTDPNPNNDNTLLKSRLLEPIDQVVLNASETIDLAKPIYFSVYGNVYSQVLITFEYLFRPTYDEQLEKAIPVGDGAYQFTNIPDEYGERLYSFEPWWSGKENRTSVFLADVMFNRVFFYSRWNAYPKHFYTSQHDHNDTIAVYGNDFDSRHFGTFYVRLRPDFGLYDLLSKRQYIFNMFAFSQTPAAWEDQKELDYENIELGETYIGFANQTRYQDYRFMQMDMRATYTITVKRIPGMGLPQFFVGVVDRGYLNNIGQSDDGNAPRKDSFAFRGEPTPGKNQSRANLTLTGSDRSAKSPRCATVRHSAQGTDRQACFVAISVKCFGIQQCAYQLKIEQENVDTSVKMYANRGANDAFTPHPPGTVLASDYVNGKIESQNQVKYYYFPIDYELMTEGMVLLNKKQIFGTGENGDTKMYVNIIKDTEDDGEGKDHYTSWNYPTESSKEVFSTTGSGMPEIVEACNQKLRETCEGAKGCGLLVGVVGQSDTLASYRLKGFYGRNKLYLDTPIRQNTTRVRPELGEFDYYWFVINDAAIYDSENFEYQVSVATDGSGNPDLYISLMDGRFPTETDFDLRSNMAGADSIRIENYENTTMWKERGWNVKAGVVVVVGVKVDQTMNYSLILTKPPQAATNPYLTMKRMFVAAGADEVELTAEESKSYTKIYQFYNWLHRDFEITFSYFEGDQNATIMYQKQGQLDSDNNIYTGVPLGINNSHGAYNVTREKGFHIIKVNGSSCYSCWYFIRIDLKNTVGSRYEFNVADVVDNSGAFFDMTVNQDQQLTVRGNSWQRTKFVLDSMDNWVLRTVVATGDLEVYIGLNPDTVDKGGHIWKASTATGRDVRISVKTTDADFHLATYYYVYLSSTSGQDSNIRLELIQDRTVDYIGSNFDYTFSYKHPIFLEWTMKQKFQYRTNKEEVKFHVFRVPPPSTNPGYHNVVIQIDPLTPNFYPKIFLNKIELSNLQTRVQDLKYPNLINYDIAFGENPFFQLNSKNFEYTFTGQATTNFVYYTMAIYQHTWGLSPFTKSSYQIRVISDSAQGPPVVGSTMVSGHSQSIETIELDQPMFLSG